MVIDDDHDVFTFAQFPELILVGRGGHKTGSRSVRMEIQNEKHLKRYVHRCISTQKDNDYI